MDDIEYSNVTYSTAKILGEVGDLYQGIFGKKHVYQVEVMEEESSLPTRAGASVGSVLRQDF